MSTLTKGTPWTGSYDLQNPSKTVTFSTSKKYLDRNISFEMKSTGMNVPNGGTYWVQPGTSNGVPKFTFTVDSSGNITVS